MFKTSLKYFFLLILSSQLSAKLLDKIEAIVNESVITKSVVERHQKTISFRQNMSRQIYDKNDYSYQDVVNILINTQIIRNKLNEQGMGVSDEQVESYIKNNEKNMNFSREQLKGFLKNQGLSFDEYFEILKESMEYNFFISRIIAPIVSIPYQDIKNEFIKRNPKLSRSDILYSFVDYALPKNSAKPDRQSFLSALNSLRSNQVVPIDFVNVEANHFDDVTEEGLNTDFRNGIKGLNENEYSPLLTVNGQHRILLIVKKNLVESEYFLSQKDKIYEILFGNIVKKEVEFWLEREKPKNYIKLN